MKRKRGCVQQASHTTEEAQPSDETLESSESPLSSNAHPTEAGTYKRTSTTNGDTGTTVPTQEPFIRVPVGTFPASAFIDTYSTRQNVCNESWALDDILTIYPPVDDDNGYVSIVVDDFEIYRPNDVKRLPGTLASLNELNSVSGDKTFCFDGIIGYGGKNHYVQGVRFDTLCVDGYGPEIPHVTDIYIQSHIIDKSEIYYRLGCPSSRYAPYHTPFLWLAHFAKYFVDFLEHTVQTTLADFRSRFHHYVCQQHPGNSAVEKWLEQYPRTDFRQVVAAHYEYLWKEATDTSQRARTHPLWAEVDCKQLGAIKPCPEKETKTIVTPYVYDCFKHMYFKEHLKTCRIHPGVLTTLTHRAKMLKLSVVPSSMSTSSQDERFTRFQRKNSQVQPGQVVIVQPDDLCGESNWLAYVQDTERDRSGEYLKIIWLYRPSETICDSAVFPNKNEIFMSDHCNCGDPKIRPADVDAILDVKFVMSGISASPDLPQQPFARQFYVTPNPDVDKEAAFVSLKLEHFSCTHITADEYTEFERVHRFYSLGSTALVKIKGLFYLQPVVILKHESENAILVRQLKRRCDYEKLARPNELLVSDEMTYSPEVCHS